MNKKTIITILFAIVAMAGQGQIKPDTITINFQLSSKIQGEKATVAYPDYMTFDTSGLYPVTDSEGRWSVKIPAYYPLHIQVWDDNKIKGVVWGVLNLYCRPGTSADILLDDINGHCVFDGENAEVHNAQIAYPLKIGDFHGQVSQFEMQEATRCIRDIHEQNLHRIDSLRTAHPDMPRGYVEMLNALVGYGFGMDMTQNVLVHFGEQVGDFLSQGLTTLPTEYLDLMNEVETRELLHPQGMVSRDAVTYFRDVISLESMRQKGLIGIGLDDVDDMGLELITRVYPITIIDSLDVSDDVREMMKIYYYLDKCGDEMMTAERNAFLRKHLTANSYEILMEYLENKKVMFSAPVEEDTETLTEATLDSLTDGQEIFRKLILPYRGRVIYIDVWGTWCGPCREEMEHLPKLHETLNGLPVTYMYLANNSPKELWKKSAVRYGLDCTDCVNLRLPNSQQQAIEEYLGLKGYPTYVLVAPDGTIVNNNAPRPSEASRVRDAIQKLTEKSK